jgi:hypothetical protein
MTAEQLVRDQLDRATQHVPAGPDLEGAISNGRRRRRNRRLGLASAVVAVVVSAPLAVAALLPGQADRAHETQVTDAPPQAPQVALPPTDFVAGTDFDETMAAVVAAHLPSLPAPDDVYPSDSHSDGPIPDAGFARAEDWQATYTTDVGQVLVITGLPVELGGWRCRDCDTEKVAGGTLYRETYSTNGNQTWWFGTYFVGDDGRFVNVFEAVTAPDEQTAGTQRLLTDSDIAGLVEDPKLGF